MMIIDAISLWFLLQNEYYVFQAHGWVLYLSMLNSSTFSKNESKKQ